MPQSEKKVDIVYGSSKSYNDAVESGKTDDNAIYFVNDSIANAGEIYVGNICYGSGRFNRSIQIRHKSIINVGSVSENVDVTKLIEDWEGLVPPDNVMIGGVFINGLRSVQEVSAIVDYDVDDSGDEPIYTPKIVITPHYNYSDITTEIIVDVYKYDMINPSTDSNLGE